MTIATICRWGKPLAARLPKDLARSARLEEGDQVGIEEVDGEAPLRKRTAVPGLEALFAGRTAQEWRVDYREADDWGNDLGREQIPE